MESKLTEQGFAASSGDYVSKFMCSLRWNCGRCLGKKPHVIDVLDSDERSESFLQQFSYAELYQATYHFDSSNVTGHGATGPVFKATLADGRVAAIKVFANTNRDLLGDQVITIEIKVLGRLRHRNLVPLLGFCCEKNHRMLVYKFMPGGDLWSFRQQGNALTWAQKYNIVCGVASGLDFLHKEGVLHRDVKPNNILLDANQEACLAGFGISRFLSTKETHVTTSVKGTLGYLAPEYVSTLRLGSEADVYSFGMVVL
ncbi:hypothetical protein L7F22_001941 [Adiantum nelumboides]|nr:hypothetical protein [Adiantum nelumboides]